MTKFLSKKLVYKGVELMSIDPGGNSALVPADSDTHSKTLRYIMNRFLADNGFQWIFVSDQWSVNRNRMVLLNTMSQWAGHENYLMADAQSASRFPRITHGDGTKMVLRDVNARGISTAGLLFRHVDYIRPVFDRSVIPMVLFRECRMYRPSFRDATITSAAFSATVLRGADFTNSILERTRMSHCDLRGANFTNCNLRAVAFIDCDLRDANFTGADLDSISGYENKIGGAKFDRVKTPARKIDIKQIREAIQDMRQAEIAKVNLEQGES